MQQEIEKKKTIKPKSIFLTGDDGYNAPGIKLLIDILGDEHQLKISGTKEQQSGVGGKLNVKRELKWGKAQVDGVEAIWIDGTPVDAVLLAGSYFKEKFDLVVSGVNLGPNLACGGNVTSGTYSAGLMALSLGLTKKGLIMSWDCPPKYWLSMNGESKDGLCEMKSAVERVLRLAFENDFWGCDLLNINFPAENPVKGIVFTKPIADTKEFYSCDPLVDLEKNTYNYDSKTLRKIKFGIEYDGFAVKNGYISITPCAIDYLDKAAYLRVKDKRYNIFE